MKRLLVLSLVFLCCSATATEIPKIVDRMASSLAYEDFPTKKDILSICKIESDFRIDAVNPEVTMKGNHPSSNGIMQVQGGPFEVHQNMRAGVGILREYFVSLGSREAAIKAYNIGIGAYMKHKAKISAGIYWNKYLKARASFD